MPEVEWMVRTKHHDWSDRRAPAAMIDLAAEAGVIGTVEWVSAKAGAPRRAVRIEEPRPGEPLLAQLPKKVKTPLLQAGGSTPRPWSMLLFISNWVPEARVVHGISTLTFTFDGAPYEDSAGSEQLLRAFHTAHTPENTEYAAIHPREHREQFSTTHYDPAVTSSPMFAGVLWANFLGPGHIDQFDRDALKKLHAPEVRWVDDGRGLFLVTAPRLVEATTPDNEARLLQLTEVFREARTGGWVT